MNGVNPLGQQYSQYSPQQNQQSQHPQQQQQQNIQQPPQHNQQGPPQQSQQQQHLHWSQTLPQDASFNQQHPNLNSLGAYSVPQSTLRQSHHPSSHPRSPHDLLSHQRYPQQQQQQQNTQNSLFDGIMLQQQQAAQQHGSPHQHFSSPSTSLRHSSSGRHDHLDSAHLRSASPESSVSAASTGGTGASTSATPTNASHSSLLSSSSPASGKTPKKKAKLTNLDRKRICDYHVAHPKAKQEDIASTFGIERSTVSKVLRNKEKWMSIQPSSHAAKIAKHRPSKFPDVERMMGMWARDESSKNVTLTDNLIREKAKQIAKDFGLTEDQFKASSGWLEKFKDRNAIKRGKIMDPTSPEPFSRSNMIPPGLEGLGATVLDDHGHDAMDTSEESTTNPSEMDGVMDSSLDSYLGSRQPGTSHSHLHVNRVFSQSLAAPQQSSDMMAFPQHQQSQQQQTFMQRGGHQSPLNVGPMPSSMQSSSSNPQHLPFITTSQYARAQNPPMRKKSSSQISSSASIQRSSQPPNPSFSPGMFPMPLLPGQIQYDDAITALQTVKTFLQQQGEGFASPNDYMAIGELMGRVSAMKGQSSQGQSSNQG